MEEEEWEKVVFHMEVKAGTEAERLETESGMFKEQKEDWSTVHRKDSGSKGKKR